MHLKINCAIISVWKQKSEQNKSQFRLHCLECALCFTSHPNEIPLVSLSSNQNKEQPLGQLVNCHGNVPRPPSRLIGQSSIGDEFENGKITALVSYIQYV